MLGSHATFCRYLGVKVRITPCEDFVFTERVCGCLVQTPDTQGSISDISHVVNEAHASGVRHLNNII